MPPILSIVGKSNSGKTTLLESLITELKRRGYRVAVIKHPAENLEVDTVNKDTWRFSRAGSDTSAITSGRKLAVFKNIEGDFIPEDLARFVCPDYDLILTEGFKQSSYPKIEVHRKDQGKDLLSPPEQLLAVVTDAPVDVKVPQFAKEETKKIIDLIESTLLKQNEENNIDLYLNDEYIPTKPATKNLLARTLVAMTSGLKRAGEIRSLRVFLRRKV